MSTELGEIDSLHYDKRILNIVIRSLKNYIFSLINNLVV